MIELPLFSENAFPCANTYATAATAIKANSLTQKQFIQEVVVINKVSQSVLTVMIDPQRESWFLVDCIQHHF